MGLFDSIKSAFGWSEEQREAQKVADRIKQENAAEATNLAYIGKCIDAFYSNASLAVRVAHLGKATGTLTFMLESYPHRDDWRNWLEECQNEYKKIMNAQMEGELESLLARAELAKTRASKITSANKGLLLIQKAQEDPDIHYSHEMLEVWVNKFTAFIYTSELSELLMKADKMEFKGEWKKAASAYQDVLFFLKRDHIPDEEQADQIAEIEEKIAEMQKYQKKDKVTQ